MTRAVKNRRQSLSWNRCHKGTGSTRGRQRSPHSVSECLWNPFFAVGLDRHPVDFSGTLR